MPNIKHIMLQHVTPGYVAYCLITREADGMLLDGADGGFSATPAAFPVMTPHQVIPARYDLMEDRTIWDDGDYTVLILAQAGSIAVVATDPKIGLGGLRIKGDIEVELDDFVTTRLAASAYTAPDNAGVATINDTVNRIESRVNNLTIVSRVAVNLPAEIGKPLSGNRWLKIQALLFDANGVLMDPPDLTDPGGGARLYNGFGVKIYSETFEQVTLYHLDQMTPLEQVAACHHASAAIHPQNLVRESTGIYSCWMLVADNTPAAAWTLLFGWFDTAPWQPGFTIASHIQEMRQIIVKEAQRAALQSDVTAARDAVIAALPPAPDNVGIRAIRDKTDNLPPDPASNTQVDTRLAASAYTDPSNVTVEIDTTAIAAAVWNEPLADHVTPGTAGGQFHIPDYNGPVAVIPAPPSPSLQTLYGYVKELGAAWSAGDIVKATPARDQLAGGAVLDNTPLTSTVAADGTFSLFVDKGARLVIEVGDYYRKVITITDEDNKNLAAYP